MPQSDADLISQEAVLERLERLLTPSPADASGVADVTLKMVVLVCPACGVPHALPVELLAATTKSAASVHCPNGHATQVDTFPGGNAGMFAMYAKALIDLRKRTSELSRAKMELMRAAATTPQPVDNTEFTRRLNVLISRTSRPDGRRPLCPFCGKSYGQNSDVRDHLRRKHAEQVKALPAGHFD